jgi:hypothetical protein
MLSKVLRVDHDQMIRALVADCADQALRNAIIRAERPSVLDALSLDAYERIKVENPAIGQAL